VPECIASRSDKTPTFTATADGLSTPVRSTSKARLLTGPTWLRARSVLQLDVDVKPTYSFV